MQVTTPGSSRHNMHMSEGDHGQVLPSKSFEIDWRTKNIKFKVTDKQQDWQRLVSNRLARLQSDYQVQRGRDIKFRLVGQK